jgi:serine/threonine protein kinase
MGVIMWNKAQQKKKSKPVNLSSFHKISKMTLKDLLNDPDIPHIPWGDIEIGERIGVGATGIVYQGTWSDSGQGFAHKPVALKQLSLRNQALNNITVLKDILMEIKLMCALDDPHIVRFFGISLSPQNQLHLVMELMENGNVRMLLDAKGENLPWKLRLKFALDTAKGMAYLHQYHIVHRDLKPQNLLVNETWKCKVADFGICCVIHGEANSNDAPQATGTPIYMAPEAFLKNEFTEKVDVYAFGIMLHELYTGCRPYSTPDFSGMPQNQLLLVNINFLIF